MVNVHLVVIHLIPLIIIIITIMIASLFLLFLYQLEEHVTKNKSLRNIASALLRVHIMPHATKEGLPCKNCS